MALINCDECNRSISDQAHNCPHCGYPMRDKSPQSGSSSPFFGYMALIIGLYVLFPSIESLAGRIIGSWRFFPEFHLPWLVPDLGLLVYYAFWSFDMIKLGALFLVVYGALRVSRSRMGYWRRQRRVRKDLKFGFTRTTKAFWSGIRNGARNSQMRKLLLTVSLLGFPQKVVFEYFFFWEQTTSGRFSCGKMVIGLQTA